MSKVYAKTIDPAYVDWKMWMEPYIEGGQYILDGGRELCSFNLDILKGIDKVVTDVECGDVSFKEAVLTHLKKEDGKAFTEEEISSIKKAYDKNDKEELNITVLSIIKGKEYDVSTITGCSQGEYAKLYSPIDTAPKVIDDIEAIYFGTGTEVNVYEGEDKPKNPATMWGASFYTSSYKYDDIKKEIADYVGCKPSEVVLYEFDGYTKTPKYKLVN